MCMMNIKSTREGMQAYEQGLLFADEEDACFAPVPCIKNQSTKS